MQKQLQEDPYFSWWYFLSILSDELCSMAFPH